eukprot:6022436-Pleurochrysis_carterae.AAC.1
MSAQALLTACAAADESAVAELLSAGADPCHQEDAGGVSPLMMAAKAGSQPIVTALLKAGAPWNAIDRCGRCAGEYALDAGKQAVVDLIVDHAVKCELLLRAVGRIGEDYNAGESRTYLLGNIAERLHQDEAQSEPGADGEGVASKAEKKGKAEQVDALLDEQGDA